MENIKNSGIATVKAFKYKGAQLQKTSFQWETGLSL